MTRDARLAALAQFLRQLDDFRMVVAQLEYEAVQLARAFGATWEQIGEEYGGISRQAARARYGRPRPRRGPGPLRDPTAALKEPSGDGP